MTRKQERENVFLIAFEESFKCNTLEEIIEIASEEERNVESYGKNILTLYTEKTEDVDNLIQSKLKGWTTSRISKVSLTIMRIAVIEMLYCDDIPVGASINEAVKLMKKYADESEYQFVNGVLGTIAKEL